MFGVQNSRAHSMHRHLDRPCSVHLQAHIPGCGGPSVPGANPHTPPLGPPPLREGQVQSMRQGNTFNTKYRALFLLCDLLVNKHR